ncbi:MAG: PilW family protein [Desulfuromonadales bacterium]|nr:PilW family protein [Desulfuromonadales bacterium]
MRNNKGFTLIELLVAMGLFIIVIMITGKSFDTILAQTSKLFRSEESNIEGVLGLEMLRHDLQQTGVGLFTEAPPLTYIEASSAPASTYNDATTHVPRALVTGDNLATTAIGNMSVASSVLTGTDYLAIKGTTLARNKAAQKWSYLVRTGSTIAPNVWPSGSDNYIGGEKFVVLRKQFSTPPRTSIELNIPDSTLEFHLTSPAFDAYTSQGNAVFMTYGIDDSSYRFPFNRSDYFVARTNSASNMPAICAQGTGVLYKASINQSNGTINPVPLVDCVADMQVVLGWDIDLDGTVDTWSNAGGTAVSGTGTTTQVQSALLQANNDINDSTTLNIRNCLKVVKVYFVVQDGKIDRNYTSPSTIPYDESSGEATLIGSGTSFPAVYTLASNMLNYRWKVYRVIVRPKNLLANQ